MGPRKQGVNPTEKIPAEMAQTMGDGMLLRTGQIGGVGVGVSLPCRFFPADNDGQTTPLIILLFLVAL
jgi:hypothetical protein